MESEQEDMTHVDDSRRVSKDVSVMSFLAISYSISSFYFFVAQMAEAGKTGGKRRKRDPKSASDVNLEKCDGCAGPTLREIFAEIDQKHTKWLQMFEINCQSYSWGSCDCEFFETARSHLGTSAFCMTHGAEQIPSSISHFLGYFVPRKMCTPSTGQMKQCAAALRALVKHCVAQGYMEKQSGKELLKEIQVSNKFKAEDISNALQQLADSGYWESLEVRAGEEEGEGEDEDEEGEGEDYDSSEFESIIDGEFRLTISKVMHDGWEMEGEAQWAGDFGGDSNAFLRLPPNIAKLGMEGASISCMNLGLRRGIWRPFGAYDSKYVCANVYPP